MHTLAGAIQPACVLQMHQCRAGIHLRADPEHTDHTEAAHARPGTGRGDRELRQHHRHRIAHIDAEGPREKPTQHDAESTWTQIIQRARHHAARNTRGRCILTRAQPAEFHAAHNTGRTEHRRATRPGHRRGHAGNPGESRCQRAPVFGGALRVDRDVRHQREDARAQLAIEAVHHRKHHHKRHHAKRETAERDGRHDGDETRTTGGTRIAQSDEEGEWAEHVGI